MVLPDPGAPMNHVPRQVVKAVAVAPLLFERRYGLLKALPQPYGLVGRSSLFDFRPGGHGRQELVARSVGFQTPEQHIQEPARNDDRDSDQARSRRLERMIFAQTQNTARRTR